MAESFSLKDHLFNARTMAQLAGEYGAALPGFDAERFQAEVLAGFEGRELLQRLEWIADCIEAQLAPDFPEMATQLRAAMPEPLDPTRSDDDFGQFIHAVPGILAARHGLEDHAEAALDLIHAATQRFSMEFHIRPFLNRWPDLTLDRLRIWMRDENYHVRRLVSEGTRPRLPWAKKVTLDPLAPLEFLDHLHADPTRYVTRSVANHLNDIARTHPDAVLKRLDAWKAAGQQTSKELTWLTRHALRGLIKAGHPGAMAALGYRADADVEVALTLPDTARINDVLSFEAVVSAPDETPVLVDYLFWQIKADGRRTAKVFKLKIGHASAARPLRLQKSHRLKGNATTFRLVPGAHRIEIQVNGVVRAGAEFELQPSTSSTSA